MKQYVKKTSQIGSVALVKYFTTAKLRIIFKDPFEYLNKTQRNLINSTFLGFPTDPSVAKKKQYLKVFPKLLV